MKKRLLSIIVSIAVLIAVLTMQAIPVQANGGLSTTNLNTLTKEDLVNSLVGAGVTVSNISYVGANIAAGTFTGGTGIIGFESGIILSSGDIALVVGPNKADNITKNNSLPGDADLNGLVPGYSTYDAAVLEFDFVPAGNVIKFDYVFGSEEYNEWVGSAYNDVFGFFINKVGKPKVNYALIPGTNTPVSINNVNGGLNSAYYINNDYGDLYPGPYPVNTELDGLTTVMTLTAEVIAGETYHMKLAIADAGDGILDSDVFIKKGSLISTSIAIVKTTNGQNVAGPPGPSIAVGAPVTWTYSVTNTGNVPLSNVTVTDSVVGVNPAYVSGDDNTDCNLDLTETWLFQAQGTAITGQYHNTGTAHSAPPGAVPVTADDESWYFGSGENPQPPIEVGGDVYPVNRIVILAPWLVLAIVIAVVTTILIRRRQNQS